MRIFNREAKGTPSGGRFKQMLRGESRLRPLVDAPSADGGSAAVASEVRPGDVILDQIGGRLRVLSGPHRDYSNDSFGVEFKTENEVTGEPVARIYSADATVRVDGHRPSTSDSTDAAPIVPSAYDLPEDVAPADRRDARFYARAALGRAVSTRLAAEMLSTGDRIAYAAPGRIPEEHEVRTEPRWFRDEFTTMVAFDATNLRTGKSTPVLVPRGHDLTATRIGPVCPTCRDSRQVKSQTRPGTTYAYPCPDCAGGSHPSLAGRSFV